MRRMTVWEAIHRLYEIRFTMGIVLFVLSGLASLILGPLQPTPQQWVPLVLLVCWGMFGGLSIATLVLSPFHILGRQWVGKSVALGEDKEKSNDSP